MCPGRIIRDLILSAAAMLLILSCASISPNGVGRVKCYTVSSERVPASYDGYTVAFISDIHYPSLFSRKRLGKLVKRLREENPSILLLGGDYVTDDSYIQELFDSLSTVKPVDGIFAVLGNHEHRNSDAVVLAMEKCGIRLLRDENVCLVKGLDSLNVFGVKDSFANDTLVADRANAIAKACYTILLCHTPDYAERTSSKADLVLSGHTHGGQVTLFGLYTPVKNSVYGTRFLRGLNHTSQSTTVITTNGVGTSRKKLRFCVPSEVVIVTLRKLN